MGEVIYNKENSGHSDSWEVGSEFQDFVSEKLLKDGIVIQNFSSTKYQFARGENLQGIEIKIDNRFNGYSGKPATDRLSIEIAEKKSEDSSQFWPSGIFRNDNSWLYIVGNQKEFFMFSIKFLRSYFERYKPQVYDWRTIRRYFLPYKEAVKFCLKQFKY